MRRELAIRVGLGTAAALAVIGLSVAPASAHVTVKTADTPAKGGFATIAFQVPTELPDASTTKLRVQFPQDHPLLYVSVEPVAGWKYTIEKAKLPKPESPYGEEITEAVSVITWEGGQIKPGEFQRFPVSVGPLPDDADSVSFPAIQTYDNGTEVTWIEKPTADGKEPEHPAPTLMLTAKAAEGCTTAAPSPAAGAVTPAGGSSSGSSDTTGTAPSDSSKGLAIAGLVLGVVALGVAIYAAVAARARTGPSSPA
jgi:uncharacterized protein YcnI